MAANHGALHGLFALFDPMILVAFEPQVFVVHPEENIDPLEFFLGSAISSTTSSVTNSTNKTLPSLTKSSMDSSAGDVDRSSEEIIKLRKENQVLRHELSTANHNLSRANHDLSIAHKTIRQQETIIAFLVSKRNVSIQSELGLRRGCFLGQSDVFHQLQSLETVAAERRKLFAA
jgi:hypothetical protein